MLLCSFLLYFLASNPLIKTSSLKKGVNVKIEVKRVVFPDPVHQLLSSQHS